MGLPPYFNSWHGNYDRLFTGSSRPQAPEQPLQLKGPRHRETVRTTTQAPHMGSAHFKHFGQPVQDMLSGTGGSSGWQAPEQLLQLKGLVAQQGRRLDVFSFGLVLYWLLAGGRHPCGEAFERDYNILQVLLCELHMSHHE